MRVAQLQAADAARYRTLMLQAYELAADAFTSTAAERAAEPESFWARRIANPTGLGAVFGAFEGEELVGTVALEFSARPKTKHKGHVIGMYVAPQARGTGAGRALAAAVIAHGRGCCCSISPSQKATPRQVICIEAWAFRNLAWSRWPS